MNRRAVAAHFALYGGAMCLASMAPLSALFQVNQAANFSFGGIQFMLMIVGLIVVPLGVVFTLRGAAEEGDSVWPVVVRAVTVTAIVLLAAFPVGYQTVRAIPVVALVAIPMVCLFLLTFRGVRRVWPVCAGGGAAALVAAVVMSVSISNATVGFYAQVEAKFGNPPPAPVSGGPAEALPADMVSVTFDLNKREWVRDLKHPADISQVTTVIMESYTRHLGAEWWWVDSNGNKVAFDHQESSWTVHRTYVDANTWRIIQEKNE